MKVYAVPLSFAEHHIDILVQAIRCAFTGPLVLWFSYVLTIKKRECTYQPLQVGDVNLVTNSYCLFQSVVTNMCLLTIPMCGNK